MAVKLLLIELDWTGRER